MVLIDILYGVIYVIALSFMIMYMHDNACFKSWDHIIKMHTAEVHDRTESFANLDTEQMLEEVVQSNLRIQLFGKSNLDMEYLGYDLWVKKIQDIGTVDRQFKHLL